MILATLAVSLLIQTKNLNDVRHLQPNNYNQPSIIFILGDSLVDRQAKEKERKETIARQTTRTYQSIYVESGQNPYKRGWCTWYAAEKKGISTSYGDAKYWPTNSQEPQAGAVIVTYESPRGHVGYVESVDGDLITISEMNYAGWGVVSRRTINKNYRLIKGYLI